MIVAVNLKLPTFWSNNMDTWFAQAEAQFSVRNICLEEMRYCYVITALDNAASIRVVPLLSLLPNQHNYSDLKKTFGQSPDQRAWPILSISELSKHLPQSLWTLLWLHSHETPSFLLKFLFKRLLPQPVRHAISSFNELGQGALTTPPRVNGCGPDRT